MINPDDSQPEIGSLEEQESIELDIVNLGMGGKDGRKREGLNVLKKSQKKGKDKLQVKKKESDGVKFKYNQNRDRQNLKEKESRSSSQQSP